MAIEPWRPLEGTLAHVIGVQVGAWHWSQASPVIENRIDNKKVTIKNEESTTTIPIII